MRLQQQQSIHTSSNNSTSSSTRGRWRRRRTLLLTAVAWAAQQVCGHWVDPDTPPQHHTTSSLFTNKTLRLAFSDEFEMDGRSFEDGQDPRW
jgi:Beta-glucan synthesis-associated protein SKN1/KRE6/Sbg1